MPLNVEIEDSLNYLQTSVYESLKKSCYNFEKQSSTVWSENLRGGPKKVLVLIKFKTLAFSLSESLVTQDGKLLEICPFENKNAICSFQKQIKKRCNLEKEGYTDHP